MDIKNLHRLNTIIHSSNCKQNVKSIPFLYFFLDNNFYDLTLWLSLLNTSSSRFLQFLLPHKQPMRSFSQISLTFLSTLFKIHASQAYVLVERLYCDYPFLLWRGTRAIYAPHPVFVSSFDPSPCILFCYGLSPNQISLVFIYIFCDFFQFIF